MFHFLPEINVQALYGVLCLMVTWILVKITRAVLDGHLPGGTMASLYLRMLLGFFVTAAVILLGCALFNILLI